MHSHLVNPSGRHIELCAILKRGAYLTTHLTPRELLRFNVGLIVRHCMLADSKGWTSVGTSVN